VTPCDALTHHASHKSHRAQTGTPFPHPISPRYIPSGRIHLLMMRRRGQARLLTHPNNELADGGEVTCAPRAIHDQAKTKQRGIKAVFDRPNRDLIRRWCAIATAAMPASSQEDTGMTPVWGLAITLFPFSKLRYLRARRAEDPHQVDWPHPRIRNAHCLRRHAKGPHEGDADYSGHYASNKLPQDWG